MYFRKRKKIIGTRLQGMALTGKYPDSQIVSVGPKNVSWEGYLRPTPFSESYLIRVEYTFKKRPNAFVLEPELTPEKKPHIFEHDGSLCLFRSKYREWDTTMLIADTIIPWTSLWLYFYEQWLVTRKWLGGGEHPNSKEG